MRLSIWPLAQQSWVDLLDAVTHADGNGWHGAYVADHFMGDGHQFGGEEGPTWEATAAVAALAAATSRLRVGTLVLSATYRHPAVVANWASTVDHVSAGRLVLGVGAGWQVNEHEQYGITLPPPGERLRLLDETCQVLRALLDEPRADVQGSHFTITDAANEPKPVQGHLPLLLGGKGDRMLGLVARHADIWNMWALPDAHRERAAVLDAHCERLGRDPGTVERSVQAMVMVTDDAGHARQFLENMGPRAAFAGEPAAFAELVVRWQEAGIDEVVVPDLFLGRGAERRDRMDALLDAVSRAVALDPVPTPAVAPLSP
jgi:alkanesulfonate monooxygenase SsuD/methylene tetrahydromethanopterin reductase-like flavin-dependent oxidoreductase (luciferase family)